MISTGDIWLANFEPLRKGELGKKSRPSIIIQSREANELLDSATVVPISSHVQQDDEIYILLRPNKINGLTKPSIAICSHIYTINKERLIKKIGKLDNKEFESIIRGISLHLDLDTL